MLRPFIFLAVLLLGMSAQAAMADDIACVSTNIRVLGLANDKICIRAFKDPDVEGVVCHVSRAETGGISGSLGLEEDTSDAAISCNQVGPIKIPDNLKNGERVFRESRSFLFKKLQVVRFFDRANNTLIYLSYSDRLIEGSPKNAISAVPIMPWGDKPATVPAPSR